VTAGLHLRELGRVAPRHQLGAVVGGQVEQPAQGPRTHHAGLVENEHHTGPEAGRPAGVRVTPAGVRQQPGYGHCWDAGASGELPGSRGGQRAADHPVAGGVPAGGRSPQSGGLAGSGTADHDVDASA